ncbi:MAG: GatB/YqeY domain-containing protein [Nitrospiraceae bacterium]
MTTLIKQRREAADQFDKGNRADLATKERQEITIIEAYLPKAVSTDEVGAIVKAVIAETGAASLKDMGHVMKAVMARLAGQTVDGKLVSDLVKSALAGK